MRLSEHPSRAGADLASASALFLPVVSQLDSEGFVGAGLPAIDAADRG
jgi:hypothetical protein